jgi:hypothetical protein
MRRENIFLNCEGTIFMTKPLQGFVQPNQYGVTSDRVRNELWFMSADQAHAAEDYLISAFSRAQLKPMVLPDPETFRAQSAHFFEEPSHHFNSRAAHGRFAYIDDGEHHAIVFDVKSSDVRRADDVIRHLRIPGQASAAG